MALTSGFFDSLNGDRVYNAEQMSSIFDGIIRDGVFEAVGNALVVNTNTGMSVKVKSGKAWFNHCWIVNDNDYPLTIDEAEISLSRIDVVALEVNHDQSVRACSFKIIKGTPASTPEAPALIRTDTVNQYPLAHVYISPGMTSITASAITNKIGMDDCPFVSGPLETIDATAFFEHWDGSFSEFMETQKEQFRAWVASVREIIESIDPGGTVVAKVTAMEGNLTNAEQSITRIEGELSDHENNTNNPHQLTPDKIGAMDQLAVGSLRAIVCQETIPVSDPSKSGYLYLIY